MIFDSFHSLCDFGISFVISEEAYKISEVLDPSVARQSLLNQPTKAYKVYVIQISQLLATGWVYQIIRKKAP